MEASSIVGPEATIRFDPERAHVTLNDQRMLLLGADAMGQLRRDLIENLGENRARGFLTRYGWNCGYNDALSLRPKLADSDLDDLEWVAAGMRLHALEGITRVERVCSEFDRDAGTYYKEAACHHSYEAEQHELHFGPQECGVCWIMTGYASGFSSVYFGSPVVYRETRCVAKGDDCCYLVGRAQHEWGAEAADDLRYFTERPVAQELEDAYAVLREQRDELRQIVGLNDRLAGMVLRGEGLERMIKALARELDLDISVEDRLGHPLAACTAVRREAPRHATTLSLVAGGETVGRVVVAPRGDRSNRVSRVAAQQVATVCGMAVMRDRVGANVEHRLQSELFERLMRGDATGVDHVVRFIRAEPLERLGPARVIAIEPGAGRGTPQTHALLDGLAHDALRRWPGCRLAAGRGNHLLLLVEPDRTPPDEIAGVIGDQLAAAIKGGRPHIGVGGVIHDLAGIERSHRQALQAVTVARMRRGPGGLSWYDECGVHAMLSAATKGDDLVYFSTSLLEPLVRDGEEGGLLLTLRVYLAERGRNKDSAERLNVHISTLKYRLGRIEELTGLDLHDGEDFFRAGLAMRIHDGDQAAA